MAEFTMPSLGADMAGGTLVEWRIAPGDRVTRGQIVAVVETEKGAIEIETFATGVVQELRAQLGEVIPVGAVMAVFGEGAPAEAKQAPATVEPATAAEEQAQARAEQAPARAEGWVRASPAARRRAHELGIDLRAITGSRRFGGITRADVEAAASTTAPTPTPAPAPTPAAAPAPTPAAAPAPPRPTAGVEAMRHAIAVAMARSNREIPHYYLSHTIDMKRSLDWLAEQNHQRPITTRLVPGVLLIRAVARALRDFPELNGTFIDDHFEPAPGIHPGMAISLRSGGLVVPAIHNADELSIDELMAAMTDIVARARGGHLRASDHEGTITITSLGDQGVDSVLGVIYPPQVALVGFGRIAERPWAVDGMLAVRPTVTATLAGDHRVSDGHRGARFLIAVERHLQEPESP